MSSKSDTSRNGGHVVVVDALSLSECVTKFTCMRQRSGMIIYLVWWVGVRVKVRNGIRVRVDVTVIVMVI